MKVQISTSVSTIFLRLVGFGNHTVVRSETAEYLPPISLGQPGAQQGSAHERQLHRPHQLLLEPRHPDSAAADNYYFEREEGWGNPRSEGDPFTPSPRSRALVAVSVALTHAARPLRLTTIRSARRRVPRSVIRTLNYQGGSNYLIEIPVGQSADLQIYQPRVRA